MEKNEKHRYDNLKEKKNKRQNDYLEKEENKSQQINIQQEKIRNFRKTQNGPQSLKEQKKELKKLYKIIGIIVILIILLDQLSKILIINNGEISLISNTLELRVDNANSGMYDETSRAVNIMTNIVILCIIFGIIKNHNQFVTKKTKILLSFAFGGGISNVIDKIFRGGVVEFINIGNLPALNIADICIAIGWISFIAIFASFSSKELAKNKENKKDRKNK